VSAARVLDDVFVLAPNVPNARFSRGYAVGENQGPVKPLSSVLPRRPGDIYESIGHTWNLRVLGTATGTISDRRIAATSKGAVELWTLTGSAPTAKCEAEDHRLDFVR
jgi:hypothetical protein